VKPINHNKLREITHVPTENPALVDVMGKYTKLNPEKPEASPSLLYILSANPHQTLDENSKSWTKGHRPPSLFC
jgi:hypothetical protein